MQHRSPRLIDFAWPERIVDHERESVLLDNISKCAGKMFAALLESRRRKWLDNHHNIDICNRIEQASAIKTSCDRGGNNFLKITGDLLYRLFDLALKKLARTHVSAIPSISISAARSGCCALVTAELETRIRDGMRGNVASETPPSNIV